MFFNEITSLKDTIQNISIEEFGGKSYKLTFFEPSDRAILTHYLHNYENGVSKFFKKDATKILRKYIDFQKNENNNSIVEEDALQQLLFEVENVPFPTHENFTFKFIDLFAGVGGFRIAMQNNGGKCIFSSEWDKNAQETYRVNFGEIPFGDISLKETKSYIPDDFDVLCAGFPCQPFSIAGNRKGFLDTRGNLFFDIQEIVEKHRPKVVFLENVKNFVSHDKGNTFKVIAEILEQKLGYKMYHKVLNSMTHANIPQNRERIFIVAFDPKQVKNFDQFQFPKKVELSNTIHDILENGKKDDYYYYKKDHKYYPTLKKEMKSKDTVYQWRRVYVRENKSNVCPTLTANMGTGGHNVPLIKDNHDIRKLTPRECFSFQGYPKKFVLPNIARSKLYMQAGNSITLPLVQRISEEIVKVLWNHLHKLT